MRILIFHGYLLRGTGSNVYNAELARALKAAGHEVHLLCQEKRARDLEWVDAVGHWDNTAALVVEDLGREPAAGSVTVYNPPIADLLPVYVADNYEDFTAKTFEQLTEDELDFYLRRNVMAVDAVAQKVSPDVALANHMVMGPFILSRALGDDVPYAAKVHGSAMEYTVRTNPDRFLPYAIEGLQKASTVLVGSQHIAARTVDTVRIDGLADRIFLGPPGVDVEKFKPPRRDKLFATFAEGAELVAGLPRGGYGPAAAQATAGLYDRVRTAARSETIAYEEIAADVAALQGDYDNAGIDLTAADTLAALAEAEKPMVFYVGKLIVSKGVDLLLAAWPIVRGRVPDAQLVITGFGAYREGLELLLAALSDGDLVTARWIASGGRAFEGGEAGQLKHLIEFFDSLEGEDAEDARAEYLENARGMAESVHWLGRLEHDAISKLTPAMRCQVVPSTFPEAFGMVAAEAAAAGVAPVCADHSGLAEVAVQLQENLSGHSASLLTFPVGKRTVERLATRVYGLAGMGEVELAELSARLRSTAVERFSWAGVADDVIAAAKGDHESLRRP